MSGTFIFTGDCLDYIITLCTINYNVTHVIRQCVAAFTFIHNYGSPQSAAILTVLASKKHNSIVKIRGIP